MRYLSGTDTQMLYADAPHAQNIIAPLSVFDPSTAPGGQVSYDDVLEYFRTRLHLSDSFRERLVRSPLALDRPMWIRDPDFDLEYHVREIALPRPGTWEQFIAQVARIGARPLDLTKPPWEFYIIYGLDAIEGFPPGSFATMLKLHHAAVDGVAGNELVTALMQSTPDEPPPAHEDDWQPEPVPTFARRLTYAGFQTVARPVTSYRQFLRAALAAPRAARQSTRAPAGGRPDASATRFNAPVSAHRIWDSRRFDLADIKRIKNGVPGATVNDVAVALAGGALRRYLDAHAELPESTLGAIMPISVRPTSTQKAAADAPQVSPGGGGNSFAMTVIPLRTDVADPVERLKAVHESTLAAKDYGVDARALMQATETLPGALIGTVQKAVARLMARSGRVAGAHVIVTNVPGPRVPMYFCGAKALYMSGMAPVVDGMGLIIAAGSYVDVFFLCWTADREQMPDTAFFSECLSAEFDALLSAIS